MPSATDPIQGTSSGAPEEVFTYCRTWGREVDRALKDWVIELYRLCTTHGLHFEVAVGLSDLECFNVAEDLPWSSKWYRSRLNLGGIGITGDQKQDAASQKWPDGRAAARGLFLHLWGYAVGGLATMPDELREFWQEGLDRRFIAIEENGFLGIAKTIDHLSNRWAINPEYGRLIAGRMARIFGGETTEMTPTTYNLRNPEDAARFNVSSVNPGRHNPVLSEVDYMVRRCFPGRLGAYETDVVVHVQDGETVGSLDWWINGIDDDGNPIQASSTVMIQRGGSILKVIAEDDGPWTNGDVMSPAPQSAKLRARGGNPNNWCLTMELEGAPGQQTDAQVKAAAWQVQDWFGRYETLEGWANILKHAWINSVTRSRCPGSVYDEIIAELKGQGWEPGDRKPEPTPVPSNGRARIPHGSSYDLMRALFGSVKTHGRTYRFNVDGSVSQAWLKRGLASYPPGQPFTTGIWPRLEQVVYRGDGTRLFVFSDGWVHAV